jgi:hypothetical protein
VVLQAVRFRLSVSSNLFEIYSIGSELRKVE